MFPVYLFIFLFVCRLRKFSHVYRITQIKAFVSWVASSSVKVFQNDSDDFLKCFRRFRVVFPFWKMWSKPNFYLIYQCHENQEIDHQLALINTTLIKTSKDNFHITLFLTWYISAGRDSLLLLLLEQIFVSQYPALGLFAPESPQHRCIWSRRLLLRPSCTSAVDHWCKWAMLYRLWRHQLGCDWQSMTFQDRWRKHRRLQRRKTG